MLNNKQIQELLEKAFELGKAYVREDKSEKPLRDYFTLLYDTEIAADKAREELKNAVHNLPTHVEDWQEVPRLHYKVGHRDCLYQVIELLNGETK